MVQINRNKFQFELVIRNYETKRKLFQREYEPIDFAINENLYTRYEIIDKIRKILSKILESPFGDIYQDFFLLGKLRKDDRESKVMYMREQLRMDSKHNTQRLSIQCMQLANIVESEISAIDQRDFGSIENVFQPIITSKTKKIIKIQSQIKRYLAQKHFKTMKLKNEKNILVQFSRKFRLMEDEQLVYCTIQIQKKDNYFIIKATPVIRSQRKFEIKQLKIQCEKNEAEQLKNIKNQMILEKISEEELKLIILNIQQARPEIQHFGTFTESEFRSEPNLVRNQTKDVSAFVSDQVNQSCQYLPPPKFGQRKSQFIQSQNLKKSHTLYKQLNSPNELSEVSSNFKMSHQENNLSKKVQSQPGLLLKRRSLNSSPDLSNLQSQIQHFQRQQSNSKTIEKRSSSTGLIKFFNEQRKISALKLQKWYRSLRFRQEINFRIQKKQLNKQAIVIQSKFRTHQAQNFKKQLKTAIEQGNGFLLQHIDSSYLVILNQSQDGIFVLEVKDKNLKTIQKITLTELFQQNQKDMLYFIKEKIWYDKYNRKFTLSDEKEFKKLEEKAIKIQSAYRGKRARNQAKRIRRQKEDARKIQRIMRGYIGYKVYKKMKEDDEMEKSAVKIQSVFRGKKAREELKGKKEAEMVQRVMRGYLGYKIYKKIRQIKEDKEIEESVIKIQSVFRGKKVRKQIKTQDEPIIDRAPIQVQRILKGYLAYKKFLKMKKEKEDKELEQSAIKIQSVFRGKKTRDQVKNNQKEAILIQKYLKGYLSFKKIRSLKQVKELEQSAVKIQSVFRGKKARENLKQSRPPSDQTQVRLPVHVLNSQPNQDIKFDENSKANMESGRQQQRESIGIVLVNDVTNQKQVEAELLINNKNLMVVLRAEGIEPLSMLLQDIIERYGDQNMELVDKSDCYRFLKESFSNACEIRNNKFFLSDSMKIIIESVDTTSNKQIVRQEEFKNATGTIISSTFDHQETTKNQGFDLNQKINEKNILIEFDMSELKFSEEEKTLHFTVFKDIIDNIFTKVDLICDNEVEVSYVERLDPDRVKIISDLQPDTSIDKIVVIFMKEVNFRVGNMNSSLEKDEFLKFSQIERLLQAFSFKKTDIQLQKISEFEEQALKIQKAFRNKLKKKPIKPKVKVTAKINKNLIYSVDNWKEQYRLEFTKLSQAEIKITLFKESKEINFLLYDVPSSENDDLLQVCKKEILPSLVILNELLSYRSTNKQKKPYLKGSLSSVKEEEEKLSLAPTNSQISQKTSSIPNLDKVPSVIQLQQYSSQTLKEVLKPKPQQGLLTLLKEKQIVSGQSCLIEVKLNFEKDSILIKAIISSSKSSSMIEIDDAKLKGKSLKQTNSEIREILNKLELDDQGGLFLRSNFMNEMSMLSNDIILKTTIEMQNRFFLVSVINEENYIIIDAYEEKTDKHLELKIKKQFKTALSSEEELQELVQKLDIKKLGVKSEQEILMIKS